MNSEEHSKNCLERAWAESDLSPRQREYMILSAGFRKGRQWFNGLLSSLSVRLPTLSLAIFLVTIAMVGSVSLRATIFREERSPNPTDFPPGVAAPGAIVVSGSRRMPLPDIFSVSWQTDRRRIA